MDKRFRGEIGDVGHPSSQNEQNDEDNDGDFFQGIFSMMKFCKPSDFTATLFGMENDFENLKYVK